MTISRIDRLCADAVAVTFAVPSEHAAEFEFRPGQYLTLRRSAGADRAAAAVGGDQDAGPSADVAAGTSTASASATPDEARRSYSICSGAGEPPRIGVRRVDGGVWSSWLVEEARVGDRVSVLPPQGRFTPDLAVPAHHGFVAAGSGITPVLSILTSVLARPGHRATLLYGNRRGDTVMFAEELADLKDRYPDRLQIVHLLSREPTAVELFSGRLDRDRLRRLFASVVPTPDVDRWWLCGPVGLVEDAGTVLGALGVPADRVRRELFYVDAPPPAPRRRAAEAAAGPTSRVTVILDGRSTEMTLPADEPVLDAAQRVRADLPFACRGGVCGTCRARVVTGEAEMRRNYALEPAEVDAGFVLTCQAEPASAELVVDFDA
ncbi:2Fe-2S iron-sulfur cluster-binding protein [Actinoalloteichus hoggarensis]|uniref:2Fe-2S iron-sulfur cluster-binding protein n=1 Tax=Actinoalloteichus hoggarensis TaxID=1470176 RepID=UPI001FE9D93D|nr:2Fe-2S iron-sulfur cluster-binding protein [Actinoalloteichus hoggarensis]